VNRTPLYAEHSAAGGRMVEFAGWEMPVQYTSIVDEHLAVRRHAGLFDVSHMGEVVLSGPGAEACCARLFANDARRLAPGRAQYSLICNDEGGVVDDIIVYRLESDRFLVCVNASNADKDVAWIRERAAGACEIEDAGERYGLIALQGPQAASILAPLAPQAVSLQRFGCCSVEVGGSRALAARTGYTGEDGFELFVDADAAVTVWRTLIDSGRDRGLVPVGLGARDTLRLEAALPLYGHELDETTSPFECRLDWVVKLDRPDMVGFGALEAAARGGASRTLVGLETDQGIARQGCAVLDSDRSIGIVTSGSYSPCREAPMALARIEREVLGGEGVELFVEIRGKRKRAKLIDLPFYNRNAPREAGARQA
jgi:aminomethyltransferase